MEIPNKIKEIMKIYGMDDAELVGDSMYLLSLNTDADNILPQGLPLIVDYHMGIARLLPIDEALKVISRL